ncbi:MAG: hypothetical protein A2275_04695 [Bacteroidetes bacterium RIFOXYA12_FULL_35_11]|nr:MAG: hypothetical protein A2X01_13905 [Bacteroidetes bacterium GWF2_35_48]OFY73975.1 MAG: hypothetical protein A2275_04695 [Bacteroidetes bacterium RIFOXYA12_FULL_35_11]HBX52095.1 hypothetical protein [Bacteroidales bacterium]
MNKIVVIEDDAVLRENTLDFLKEEGYDTYAAMDGLQGLHLTKEVMPDLVLCDIGLPKMNGYNTCIAIKEVEKLKDVPVIFLTAFGDNEHIMKGFEAGAQDYVTKPFNYKELLARVHTHIELKKSKEKTEAEIEKVDVLNKKLKVVYNEIKNSIHYAKLIQDGMLPDMNILHKNGIDNLIIYKPKDIVSGDFYWAEYCDNKIFLAVADCTGHGVPGALLSMTGHNLLHEIINIEKIHDPAEILNNLNSRIRRVIKQGLSVVQEGMDIALCVIDMNAKTLEYAGANIPLWYFQNSVFKKLLPDKLGIGEDFTPENKSGFSKQIIEFNIGDRFFMSTDGIAAQFDNTNKKRITKKDFEQQLSLYGEHPFNSIKTDLLEFLNDWQGCNAQTDDILIVGFEIIL